jgi:hypothetical protein
MSGTNPADGPAGHTDVTRFSTRLARAQEARAPVVDFTRPRLSIRRKAFLRWLDFPFASVSVLVVLLSLFSLSMMLGGWTWSSWTYAFSLGISVPLVAIELKRKAVITGGAVVLLAMTAIVDAGLPQYFGYTASDYSWYDLLAHYLGALLLTLFLWSILWWTLSPHGPPKENGRRKLYATVITLVLVSTIFEFLELFTDAMFGWTNFHAGIDTAGDLMFDIAGIATAAMLISRHGVSALKRPFWHAEPAKA